MSAAAVHPPAGAPPRKLYRHALESIFVFVSLAELHALMAVCRDWSAAVMTMPPINASCKIRDSAHLTWILERPLRRHITALRPARPRNADHVHYALSLPELTAASTALPGLHIVRAQPVQPNGRDVDLESLCGALSRFMAVRHLEIRLLSDVDLRDSPGLLLPACNPIIEACGQLPAATMHTLKIGLLHFSADVSFAPLKALTQLRVLEVDWFSGQSARSLTDVQLVDLCAMPSIEQLVLPFYEFDAQVLRRLCPPHSVRNWTKFGHFLVTPEMVPCFASLSSLTSLSVSWTAGPDCSSLSQLTRLTDLKLCEGISTEPIDADVLTRALKTSTQIQALTLLDSPLLSRHLEELLPCFPRLSSLTLQRASVESLRAFATPALAASLASLLLGSLSRCPAAEVSHLLGLRSLQTLVIRNLATPILEEHKADFIRGERFPTLASARCV